MISGVGVRWSASYPGSRNVLLCSQHAPIVPHPLLPDTCHILCAHVGSGGVGGFGSLRFACTHMYTYVHISRWGSFWGAKPRMGNIWWRDRLGFRRNAQRPLQWFIWGVCRSGSFCRFQKARTVPIGGSNTFRTAGPILNVHLMMSQDQKGSQDFS